jgi:hypothetical protein
VIVWLKGIRQRDIILLASPTISLIISAAPWSH